jgi:hypothetical protein
MRPRLVASKYPTVCLIRLNAPPWTLRIRRQITTDRLGRAGHTGSIQNRQGLSGKKREGERFTLPCVVRMANGPGLMPPVDPHPGRV